MAIKIMDAGGVLRTITGAKIRDGATLRTLKSVKLMDGATLRTVAVFVDPMTVSASPTLVVGSGPPFSLVTTEPTTVTPSGGLAPYTYSWALQFGSGDATTGASATTTFSGAAGGGGGFRCTVTDATGQTATADVAAEYIAESGGGF